MKPEQSRPTPWVNRPFLNGFAITNGYAVAAGLLWIGIIIQLAQLQLTSDIWFHGPAINEFIVNGLKPQHIYLAEQVPHFSLNAYHLAVGTVGGAIGLSAISVAQLAGIINSAAILLLFPQFVRSYVDHRGAPLIALLLTTLAWGPGAWRWSGFLNLNSFGFGAPYPSYFAIWLSFLVIWVIRRQIDLGKLKVFHVLVIAGGGFLVANAHPITFGGLMIFALALVIDRRSTSGLATIGIMLVSVIVGILVWPFYSLIDTVNQWGVVDNENREMYVNVAVRTAPALLGLPVLALRFKRKSVDALVLVFTASIVVYIGAFALGSLTYGRVLPFGVLALHLALAGAIASWADRKPKKTKRRAVVVGGFAIILGLALGSSALVRMVPKPLLPASIRNDPRLESDFAWVVPSADIISYGQIVLAPPEISTQFAIIGAKLVTFRPVPGVPDQDQRREDARAFFLDPLSSILIKYDVDWIAFRQSDVSDSVASELSALGDVRRVGAVVLVRVP